MAILQGPWILFAPEIALISVILIHLAFELGSKAKPLTSLRSYLLGGSLIFVILCILWPTQGKALQGSFRLDCFAILLKGIFLASGLITLVMAEEFIYELKKRLSDFATILLTAVLGAFFLASANDLITLFITVEWITISLYILTAYLRTDEYAQEAGLKYLIMGAFSAALFIYGISFIYGSTGAIRFDQIRQSLSAIGHNHLAQTGFFLILAGIGFKVASFPFHLWVPDVYQGAPTPVTAFLSVVSKTAGFVALLKVLFLATGPNYAHWPFLLSLLAAATLLYGNLGALGQTNMKRLFAYSSIGHAGYLLMGVAAGTQFGTESVIYYLIAFALANLTAFLVIVIVNRESRSGEISAYRGLSRRTSFLSGVFFIAVLSLGGIPPLAGFFGKFLVLRVLMERYLWLAFLGAVNVIISLYYYLSLVKEIYFKPPIAGSEKIRLGTSIQIPLLTLTLGTIGVGVFQEPILVLVRSAAASLF